MNPETSINLLRVFLAIAPILLIFLLLITRRASADVAGLFGWAATVLIAWTVFHTPMQVILTSSLAGIVASLPIALVVAASIFQVTIMQETGAIARIITLIKTIAPTDQVVQIMLINIGFGTLLTALGAVPVSILPPIMIGLGYSSFTAIALPAIGYDALTTYALLGIPVVVFSGFVQLPVEEVGGYFARYMPAISTCIAIGMLWIVGRWRMMWCGLVPALLSGVTAGFIAILVNHIGLIPITGVAAGLGVILVMLLYLIILRKPLVDRAILSETDLQTEKCMSLLAATSPWLILILVAFLVNAPFLPFYNLTFKQFSMPIEIIAGAPEKIRLFWQAYFWIFVTTIIALPFHKTKPHHLKSAAIKWLKRAPRPVLAAAVFFAIAYVINQSGKDCSFTLNNPDNNMIVVIANACAAAFGRFYPFAAPYLGLLGGFISGSEASSIAMFTGLHLSTAEKIGALGLLIAAASGIGGGLASVISPAKLQNAAASIDKIGEESRVIPITFIISLIITGICALMTFLWAFR
jgi:lactate permease